MKRKETATESESEKRTRITLDLSDRSYRRLNELAELVEADSKAAVMRQALQCFEYIAKLSTSGAEFWVHHPGGHKEKLVFFFPIEQGEGALATTLRHLHP
jgi:hypothetical protein